MSWIRTLAPLLFALLAIPTARSGVAPESPTTEVRSSAPGMSYRGTIVVHNGGKTPADVKLYQTDYAFEANGTSNFASPGTLPRSNAPWLHLSQEQISIPPGESAGVDYEVRVPEDGRLTGTYWSAVMVEPLGGAEGSRGRAEVQLRQVMRYAIQVITEIGESGRGELTFRNARLSSERGKRELSVDVANTGERWLQTQVWLELHDPTGHAVGKFIGERLRTFPATSVRNHIDLTKAPPGKYLALLVADGGRNDLFGTQIELDLR